MNILIACEESQRICLAFREKGHNAYSCDIIECSGGHPEYHIQDDCLKYINGNCEFTTADGQVHKIEGKWDLLIAHPPCTYLASCGNRWFNVERYGEKAIQRAKDRELAVDFFMQFVNADCEKIAIENPIGVMSTRYRKPDQIIQPFWFGDPERKSTCLWLKGLPLLQKTDVVDPKIYKEKSTGKNDPLWHIISVSLPKEERAKFRSKTFPGIAKAIADQWS